MRGQKRNAKEEKKMLLPMHKFREEMRHLETEHGAIYLQELQRLYQRSYEEDRMAEKMDAFKKKFHLQTD